MPGHRLSLQMHHHRSEHWVVIRGTAKVTIDHKEFLLHQNRATYIPRCAHHRVENPGADQRLIIEVQTGEYLGEDDIVRFSDDYNRHVTMQEELKTGIEKLDVIDSFKERI